MENGIRKRKRHEGGMGTVSIKPASSVYTQLKIIRLAFYAAVAFLLSLIVLVTLNNSWLFRGSRHYTNFLDQLSVTFGLQEKVYAVIIDAGSTGSRLLAFTFFKALIDNHLKLNSELWHEIKPGLSSYADNPKEGARSIIPLLELAKQTIPKDKWHVTPLVLKATAGLRLLPDEKSADLLREVSFVLSESGFHVTDNSYGIMDGQDEGIFSWFTVNYLMNKVGSSVDETVVALDLGGGSTQITFIPTDEDTLMSTPKEYLSFISLLHKGVQLYTHSYLGLGLMSARRDILSSHMNENSEINSPCINPIIDTEWEYGGKTYYVRGPLEVKYMNTKGQAGRLGEKRPIADYESCLRTCMTFIENKVHAPVELKKRNIVAFSYFFDRATEKGLIDPFQGGVIKLQNLAKAARETCEVPNTEQPFACLDLTYIAAFLQHGYGLKPESSIKLYKKISGHEVSWALGLAFHILSNGI